MENFIPQPGLNCNVGLSSLPMFQPLHLDTSSLCTSLTDLVNTPTPRPCKDVLRQAIRVNRIKRGQVMPYIDKSSTVPKKRKKPIEGEIPEEMLIRRKKNREAAKKCRLKQKKVLDTLQQKIDRYKDLNCTLENEIKNFTEEVTKLQCLLDDHKCSKMKTQHEQNFQQFDPGTSSGHSVIQHELPTTAAEDIANSLDDLLSELQDNDLWCDEVQHFM